MDTSVPRLSTGNLPSTEGHDQIYGKYSRGMTPQKKELRLQSSTILLSIS
ncbi:hypothetical protein DAPPUDRAFT_239407 [Daphnia pulex]|uniref:Uncharacterized protein n=1 Tax=Daphnia pulex TaxID=6669 RepID=E9G985_DAPPU|nr:hypothetical protein DAPPUDRAFT_239407 [Daphnia pulex]|eukprot:EFX84130.1 hypothetical protein DAPPUDRAFT_239407 [Daphnia pulex]